MATGSKSPRRTPAEGEAFLTSAMMPGPGPASSAARKSRAGGASASRRPLPPRHTRAGAAATRLLTTGLGGGATTSPVVLPAELSVRSGTGPALHGGKR